MGRTTDSYNQCAIINTGFTMVALAFMDVYPTESAYFASNAIRAADTNLTEFSLDGAYREGAGYWQYTMQFVAQLLSSLDIIFDTCFSLELHESADYCCLGQKIWQFCGLLYVAVLWKGKGNV